MTVEKLIAAMEALADLWRSEASYQEKLGELTSVLGIATYKSDFASAALTFQACAEQLRSLIDTVRGEG